jgi:hypothetical protein
MKVLERRAARAALLRAFLTERSSYARVLITKGLIHVLGDENQRDVLQNRDILPSFRKIVDREQLLRT